MKRIVWIGTMMLISMGQLALSQDATMILFSRGPVAGPTAQICRMDVNGSSFEQLTNLAGYASEGCLSADGSLIAFASNASTTGATELFLMDSNGNNVRQLTFNGDPYGSEFPEFRSPSKLWFKRGQGYASEIWETDTLGTGQTQISNFQATHGRGVNCFDLDGSHSHAVFDLEILGFASTFEIYLSNITVSQDTQLTLNSTSDGYPKFSPDESKIAFYRSEAGAGNPSNIYVMMADGSDQHPLTFYQGNQGVAYPSWTPDGSEILYPFHDGSQWDIYAVDMNGTQRNLTNSPEFDEFISDVYDVAYGQCAFVPGDVNGDCRMNGMDVVYMVTYLKGGPALIRRADCQ